MWWPLGVIAFRWCCHIFGGVIMFVLCWCPHICVLLSIRERKELWRQGGEEIFLCKAKKEAILWHALFLELFFFGSLLFVHYFNYVLFFFCESLYWREHYQVTSLANSKFFLQQVVLLVVEFLWSCQWSLTMRSCTIEMSITQSC